MSLFRNFLVAASVLLLCHPSLGAVAEYVIQISVDGLGTGQLTTPGTGYLQNLINTNQVPNFARLMNEGAYTFNARNDYDITETLQNHTSMITARGVYEGDTNAATTTGHFWSINGEVGTTTIAQNRANRYVASVFDVAHDNGLKTGLFATKTKFNLYNTSYNNNNGAPDTTGADNGLNKIGKVSLATVSTNMMSALTNSMTVAEPINYAFVHFLDPDYAGHTSGWGSTAYYNSIKAVDVNLGKILGWIDNPASPLHGRTTVILTADHGGTVGGHGVASLPLNYTIPFMVWGAGVTPGDLYDMNSAVRTDPGSARILYSAEGQPIRHADGANLALGLLGLGPIPGSTVNANQSLVVPEPSAAVLAALAAIGFVGYVLRRRHLAAWLA